MVRGFISGAFRFDIHQGYSRIFKFAKQNSQHLTVHIVGQNRPEELEKIIADLNKIKEIDKILYGITITEALNIVKPNFVFKGIEFKNKRNTEESFLSKSGGKIIFYDHRFDKANVELDRQINLNYEYILDFTKKHNIDTEKLHNKLSALEFKETTNRNKFGILGEIIIDQNVFCTAVGVSKEDEHVIYQEDKVETSVGGASIVYSNLKDITQATLFSCVDKKNVEHSMFEKYPSVIHEDNYSVIKRRYRNNKGQVLFRKSILPAKPPSQQAEEDIIRLIKNSKIKHLIVSDFNYGLITSKILQNINKLKIDIYADSQISSQSGDILKFKNITLLTPTEYEARFSCKDFRSSLNNLSREIIKKTKTKFLLITLGDEGALLCYKQGNKFVYDHIGAINKSPIDISGAGDSMLSFVAYCLSNNFTIHESLLIGSIASAIQISRFGNQAITLKEIKSHLRTYLQ
jgi:bifunctional ADP-heptose synthase (sugar kinase/adenylyltransferase)